MPRWANDEVEVGLGKILDGQGKDKYMLEIVAPVYPIFSAARTALAHNAQEARIKVFGYVDVIDLSNVPIDTPGLQFPNDRVLHAEIYEPETHRMRYQYVGRATEDFKEEHMTWGGQLAIDAPKKEIDKPTFTCDNCHQTFGKAWSDEEALAEMDEKVGPHVGSVLTLCDDCYEKATMADAENLEVEDERPG